MNEYPTSVEIIPVRDFSADERRIVTVALEQLAKDDYTVSPEMHRLGYGARMGLTNERVAQTQW